MNLQENETVKRVACLYRVSSKIQVQENDIPMQRNACSDFIATKKDWVFVRDYYEKGVSGYKRTIAQRDVLQQVRVDAEQKKFDVLLVFMFDRLGRKEDETPFIVEWFVKKGVQVWSVKEGEQRFDSRVDKLINYIRYWQSGGESEKTGIRVNEKHQQMTREGSFRGGLAPYGYRLVYSGAENAKGRKLKKMEIDEEESRIVRLAFDLTLTKGYGGFRIAKYLNDLGIRARRGGEWTLAVINYMLRNPIYKGYLSYGKTTGRGGRQGRVGSPDWILSDQPVDKLVIIPEEQWEQAKALREKRVPEMYREENIDYSGYPLNTKSPLLFVGMTKCGCCGHSMCTTYVRRKWTSPGGEAKKLKPAYRCVGKTSGKLDCSLEEFNVEYEKVDKVVMGVINDYLDSLARMDLAREIERIRAENLVGDEKEHDRLSRELAELCVETDALEQEAVKCLMGKSQFTPEMISRLLAERKSSHATAALRLQAVEEGMATKLREQAKALKQQTTVPVWREEFQLSGIEEQKMLLQEIVQSVTIYNGRIDVCMKISSNRFMQALADRRLLAPDGANFANHTLMCGLTGLEGPDA